MAQTDKNVAKTEPVFSDEQLGDIKSFEQAQQMLADAGIQVTDAEDYGSGFVLMEKDSLVNKPFLIIDWTFNESRDYMTDGAPNSFVSIRVMTENGSKGVINDGSTGIMKQVAAMDAKGKKGGVLCKNGLSKSEYPYTDERGNTSTARTFYIAN